MAPTFHLYTRVHTRGWVRARVFCKWKELKKKWGIACALQLTKIEIKREAQTVAGHDGTAEGFLLRLLILSLFFLQCAVMYVE